MKLIASAREPILFVPRVGFEPTRGDRPAEAVRTPPLLYPLSYLDMHPSPEDGASERGSALPVFPGCQLGFQETPRLLGLFGLFGRSGEPLFSGWPTFGLFP